MGKKAKKKIHKKPVQKPKKLQPSNAIAKTENTESIETIISEKACKHLDKGIDLEKLNNQLGKSPVLKCQGCLKCGIGGKKEKKGKAKHVKNKGGSKDLRHLPSGSIWVCLACGQLGCGGEEKGLSSNGHAWQHWLYAHHPYAVQCNANDILGCWCFLCKTTVQDNSVVDREESCQSLQLQALKLVQEKLLNQTMISDANGGPIWSGENATSDTENNQPQDLDGSSEDVFWSGRHIVRGPMTSALRKLYFETSSEGLGQGDLTKSRKGTKVNGTINPNALFCAICDKALQFKGFQQQDSHELWRYLLDCLRTEELCIIKSKGTVSLDFRASKDNADENTDHLTSTPDIITLVDRVFDGQLCSTVCCCNCGHSSMVYEPFFDLQLQIPTKQTAEKVSLPRYRGSSSPKAKLKNNARTSKKGNSTGKRRSGICDAQADVPSQEISPSCAEDRNPYTGERAENVSAPQENIEWIEPVLQEDIGCNGSARQGDTGWNGFAPREDNIWNTSASQEDTVWMDYLRSGSESDDILNQDISQTSENVQQVENHCAGIVNLECGFIASDGSETEHPPLVVGDSDVLLLPYKEVDLISDQGLQAKEESLELAQEPEKALGNHFNVTVSCTDPEPFDGFGQLFEEEETVHTQKKGGSEDFLHNASGNDFLYTDSSIVATETIKDIMDTVVTPMSLDGCLIDFTRAELLTGENAWKCEKCYSKVVESSGKPEKREAKPNQGMKTKKRSTVGSAINVSDVSSICGTHVNVEEQKLVSQDKVRDAELKVLTITNSSGLSALKADNTELCSGTIRCSDIDESIRGNWQGMNEAKFDHTGVLSSLCLADSEQQPDQEVHQLERTFQGKENIPVNVSLSVSLNDSSGKRVLCSQTEDSCNENLSRTYGSESREGIDGITQAERSASTSFVPKGEGITANLEGHNVHIPKHRSAGKGHVLDKRKSKKTEFNPNTVKQEAIKRYLISKAPSVLVIQLKRFTQDLWGRLSKLSGHVTFQERLDIRPYLDPRCPDKDNCVYYLRGVVEHMGTMRSGHYVAYVRCCEDENYQDAGRDGQPEKSLWYYASDSHVRRISFSEVLQSEAYLLFYEKHTLC
ncbi:ubiquitin carboxyl-terminal hydrolase 2 isoform X2 [Cryptomeria japonica]|uniref:ubiquitin carboxyl-terminal hydrolase 2 isoform X2 n=1 Tax=Cryptomeria japonica TaxID=3369 RepID=UPI0027D9EC88|nr:ubiquitin carboxyl-terminal hydrolase 2 isoform X2 [Cryptomeria japonica]